MSPPHPKVFKPDKTQYLASVSRNSISVASYNLLCETFATLDRFPRAFERFLQWDHRWRQQSKEIAALGADILCLQEVSIDKWSDIRRHMEETLQYEAVVQLKPHEVKLATCWRSDKFELVWWEERSRAILAELVLKVQSNGSDRSRGASSAYESSSIPRVFVVNVHLEASPYKTMDRVHQLKHALSRLANHIRKTCDFSPEEAPVVVAGDFNSTAEEPPCMLLRDGGLSEDLWESLHDNNGEGSQPSTPCSQISNSNTAAHHPFRLKDVYEVAAYVPQYTRRLAEEDGARLDFIWASDEHFDVVGVLDPLYEMDRREVERQGLPSEHHCSDHIPVGAVLRLKW